MRLYKLGQVFTEVACTWWRIIGPDEHGRMNPQIHKGCDQILPQCFLISFLTKGIKDRITPIIYIRQFPIFTFHIILHLVSLGFYSRLMQAKLKTIRHSQNAPCLPRKHASTLFSISLGTAIIPRRNEKQRLWKFWRANNVCYGRCANDECLCTILGNKNCVSCVMWNS